MMNTHRSHRFFNFHIALIWTSLLGHWASGQEASLDSESDGSDGALFVIGSLTPTQDLSAVFDSTRNEVVAFGGQQYFPNPTIDIDHTYTFDGTSWSRKRVDISPSARNGAAIAYDSSRGKAVLYGGSFNNDCWLWDGADWAEMLPPDPETLFYRYAMAFDSARGETIMAVKPEFGSAEMDTWGFDGASWTKKTPATPIPAQNGVAIAYDETLQKIIMLLRANASEFQTWTWDGADWTQVTTDAVNIDPNNGSLVYDGRTNTTIFLSQSGNFTFTGSNWIPLGNVPAEFAFGVEQIVYHPVLNALLRLNGFFQNESDGTQRRNETWAWHADGTAELLTSGSFVFDMSAKADGIWNYTTIDIGPNVVVNFDNNEANTPLRWLASGDVAIEGTLNLSGKQREILNLYPHPNALGGLPGPGGYEGATAGPLGANLKVPGGGPGGGLYDGSNNSEDGEFASYGNPWLFPLTGGSGAGNSSSTGGGGGGGALLIASSAAIIVNGQIVASGGLQNNSIGAGSGGGVLLRANAIRGNGTISASRVRLEAWQRELNEITISSDNNSSNDGPPLLPVERGENSPRLWVDSIDGSPVSNPRLSSESVLVADAYLSGDGTVPIVIKGVNIPDLAEISLKISLQDGTILEPEVAIYSSGQATFNVDLPEGYGAIAVTATFPWNL